MNIHKKSLYTKIHVPNPNKGFSLIELLVTVSIFTIITGIVLANFPTFSSKIALENLANEVALAVRQAQVFGVASREFGVGSGVFPTHGVHFDKAQNTTFFLYADTNENNKYDGDAELIETFTIHRRNSISQLCGFQNINSACKKLNYLDITFTRPNPEPTIIGRVGMGNVNYSYSTITMKSPSGNTRLVTVWSNGQIAIK